MANRNAKDVQRLVDNISKDVAAKAYDPTEYATKEYVDETFEKKADVVEVVPNPELEGDEADLTGLQVGDTKYKVPQGGGGGRINEALYNSIVVPPSNLVSLVGNQHLDVERLLDSLQKRVSTDYHYSLNIASYWNDSASRGSALIYLSDYSSGQYQLTVLGQEIVVGQATNYESIRNFFTSNKEAIESVIISPDSSSEDIYAYCEPQTVCLSTTYDDSSVFAERLVFSFEEVMSWFGVVPEE